MSRIPIQIVHVIPHDGLGGVEVAARSMAGCGDKRLCSCRLLLIAGEPATGTSTSVIGSPYRSAWNPLAFVRAIRLLQRARPDVGIFSLWKSVPVLLAMALVRPRPKLVYFLNAERSVHVLDRLLSKLGVLAADEVWADSSATLRARLPSTNKNRRVISFVTDRLHPIEPFPEPRARFVSWSRLVHQKGLDRAIRMIALLVEREVDAYFDIWGPDGGKLDSLRAMVANYGLSERVRFCGPVARAQLSESVAGASFFLQPSRFEGLSMACVEAMQLGLVPLVTPVGEIANYVRHRENGIHIDPRRLDVAADEIIELISRPETYRAMRDQAIAQWKSAPLYSDDVCAAARTLAEVAEVIPPTGA